MTDDIIAISSQSQTCDVDDLVEARAEDRRCLGQMDEGGVVLEQCVGDGLAVGGTAHPASPK